MLGQQAQSGAVLDKPEIWSVSAATSSSVFSQNNEVRDVFGQDKMRTASTRTSFSYKPLQTDLDTTVLPYRSPHLLLHSLFMKSS